MRMWRVYTAGLVLGLSVCGTAAAQEAGKVGVTMGFPGSVGIIWHATGRIAVRPEFSFTRTTTDVPITTKAWTVGTGVSGLFYVSSHDNVHTYVSPRFTYTKSRGSAQSTAISDTSAKATGFAGSFGAQYSPSQRFSVFGEAGLGYTHSSNTSGIAGIDLKANAWGTR